MEMAPAILAVPVIWLLWRPKIRTRPLVLAAVGAVMLWYPYLRFERERRFVDLRSQVLQESIRLVDFPRSWCDPRTVPASWLDDAARERAIDESRSNWSLRRWLLERIRVVAGLWSENFGRSRIPASRYGLFLLALTGLGTSLVPWQERSSGDNGVRLRRRLRWLAAGAAILGIAFNEFALAPLSADGVLAASSIWTIRGIQACLMLGALLLALFTDTAAAWAAIARARVRPPLQARAFGICLVVPWLVLFLLSTVDRRFWQLWPLQAIALSAASVYVLQELRFPPFVRWMASAAVVVIVASNAVLLSRVDSWLHDGWAGQDAPEVGVVDAIAGRMQAKTRGVETSIGYQVDFWRFMADANAIDPHYKVGADIDTLLRYRHGIVNVNRCAEGFRPGDDYRVVQTAHYATVNSHGLNRLEPADAADGAFAVVSHVDPYEVLERR